MQNIKHIVYVMLENRSFDQVLGWLYENDTPEHFIPSTNPPPFNGLQPSFFNPDKNGAKHYVTKITDRTNDQIPSVDPNEEYEHVNYQLFLSQQNPNPGTVPGMKGFYMDYASKNSQTDQIMACYNQDGLPVLNYLAKTFAVSDEYYSSVPTQTNCNRAFAGSGNSIGTLDFSTTAMVDNHWWGDDPYEFNGPTMWNVLNDNGYYTPNDWMIFHNQLWPDNLPGNYCFTQDIFWPSLQKDIDHFADIQNFYDMATNGTLPTFSFIEPMWYEIAWNGTDYHPPANLSPGEQFLFGLYYMLRRSPSWNDTLLIINFDEHGGTYDHVPPPWGASPPWANPADGTAKPSSFEAGFQFDRFGVRVPLILVSPRIQNSTVFRSGKKIPYDHTSVIATILNHFGIAKSSWKLGSRVANAPTFENVVTLENPRTDIPDLEQPAYKKVSGEDSAPNDLQLMIVHRMIARELQKTNFPKEKFQPLYDEHFKDIKTMRELNAASKKLMSIIREK